MRHDPTTFVDFETREFWPHERARLSNFGVLGAAGPLGERYRVFCRAQYRGLMLRMPRCYCQAGLLIEVPPGGRPESARLTVLHAVGCPRRGGA